MTQLAMILPQHVSRVPTPTSDIRQATDEDADGLALLLSSAFPEETWDATRVRRDLLDAADVATTYVAVQSGEAIATASARYWTDKFPGVGYVHWVAVDPASRGQKWGLKLTQSVIERFKQDGTQKVILETDDARLPAITTYLSLGFVPHYLAADHENRWSQVFIALSERRSLNSVAAS